MAKRAKESYAIQSVMHALGLLEQFHGDEPEIGVTELARRLTLHKNNVFRLLATLETRGYVVQNPESEGYRLGVKALELGRSYLRHTDIVSVAGSSLVALRDATGETVYLTLLQGEEVVYVLVEESPQSVRVASRVGQHHPALNTAAGRVQLAYLKVLPYQTHPLRRVTDPRPADLRKIERELAKIRETGYAIDEGTFDADVTCIAAPVFSDDGTVVGAVSLHAPSFRAGAGKLDALVRQTVATANDISRTLGYARDAGTSVAAG